LLEMSDIFEFKNSHRLLITEDYVCKLHLYKAELVTNGTVSPIWFQDIGA
jgi:hypothetical protein